MPLPNTQFRNHGLSILATRFGETRDFEALVRDAEFLSSGERTMLAVYLAALDFHVAGTDLLSRFEMNPLLSLMMLDEKNREEVALVLLRVL